MTSDFFENFVVPYSSGELGMTSIQPRIHNNRMTKISKKPDVIYGWPLTYLCSPKKYKIEILSYINFVHLLYYQNLSKRGIKTNHYI